MTMTKKGTSLLKLFWKYFTKGLRMKDNDQNDNPKEKQSEIPDFTFPDRPGNFAYHTEVIVYSYYLKVAGCSQKLNYGDYYYKRDSSDDAFRVYLYLSDGESASDQNIDLASSNFVRMVAIEEALLMIKFFGFNFKKYNGMYVSSTLSTTMDLYNDTLNVGLQVTASNPHACYLKSAYLATIHSKTITEANKVIEKEGIFRVYPEKP